MCMGTKKLSWLGVELVISRSLVKFPAWAVCPVLGQDSASQIAPVCITEYIVFVDTIILMNTQDFTT